MSTRSPLTFLAGCALVLACACTPGVAGGPAPLAIHGIEISPAEQAIDRVMLRTAAAELVVENIAPAHAKATALARILGGRVEREVITERSAMLTLRLPDAVLEPLWIRWPSLER